MKSTLKDKFHLISLLLGLTSLFPFFVYGILVVITPRGEYQGYLFLQAVYGQLILIALVLSLTSTMCGILAHKYTAQKKSLFLITSGLLMSVTYLILYWIWWDLTCIPRSI